MNTKTFLAALTGAVAHFFLGFLIYGVLLMDFMQSNTTHYEGLMMEGNGSLWGYVISSTLFAILITYILKRTGVKSAGEGLKRATLVSILFIGCVDTIFFFGMNLYTPVFVVVDMLAYTVMGGLIGLVVGFVLVRGRNRVRGSAGVA